jgi:L-ascorbate metabolism protein UlaG (beta-lactamase superfamily)
VTQNNDTQDGVNAAQSVRAKLTIPHHFGTFPGIAEMLMVVSPSSRACRIPYYEMRTGETISFRGRQLVRTK